MWQCALKSSRRHRVIADNDGEIAAIAGARTTADVNAHIQQASFLATGSPFKLEKDAAEHLLEGLQEEEGHEGLEQEGGGALDRKIETPWPLAPAQPRRHSSFPHRFCTGLF